MTIFRTKGRGSRRIAYPITPPSGLRRKARNINPHNTLKIMVEWHEYKGDGKSWAAETDENGKVIRFLQPVHFRATEKTGRGAYGGVRTYELENGKYYMIHEPYTKTYARRGLFRIEGGKPIHIRTVYGCGYYKGEPAPEMKLTIAE